jgi:hypothetical protein
MLSLHLEHAMFRPCAADLPAQFRGAKDVIASDCINAVAKLSYELAFAAGLPMLQGVPEHS